MWEKVGLISRPRAQAQGLKANVGLQEHEGLGILVLGECILGPLNPKPYTPNPRCWVPLGLLVSACAGCPEGEPINQSHGPCSPSRPRSGGKKTIVPPK